MRNFKNRKLMKLLSLILCVVLVLSGISWNGLITASAADTEGTAVYYGNGYSVSIEVTAKWNSGYNANVTIENTSEAEIRNWELVMTGANPISNIWNARKLSQEDGTLKIGNDGWNQDIVPEEILTDFFYASKPAGYLDVNIEVSSTGKQRKLWLPVPCGKSGNATGMLPCRRQAGRSR